MGKLKGISPLIASVLLIAFTMAIAGIMATWATTFSRERLDTASEEAECVGAIDVNPPSFANEIINTRVRNVASGLNLTGLTAVVEYTDPTKNKQFVMSQFGVPDPLGASATAFFVVDTNEAAKPEKMEIVAANCPKQPAVVFFR